MKDAVDHSANTLFLDLLHSISHTLNDAVSICGKCPTRDCLEGKLKTQSNIDSVLAKLDRHVQDSEIWIRSGVPGSSSSSSKREAMRAESRNLITRLQIGTADSKSSAIDSLLRLLEADDNVDCWLKVKSCVLLDGGLLDGGLLDERRKTCEWANNVKAACFFFLN
jgi:hypothetical protein